MIRQVLSLETLRAMPRDEAAALLLVRRSDGGGDLDAAALAGWLGSDARNADAWEAAQAAWAVFDDAGGDELLGAMRDRALTTRRDRRIGWQRLAAGLALAVVVGGGLLAFLDRGAIAPKTGPSPANGAVEYVTAKGQERVFALPDGSRLTLDTDSEVTTIFTVGRRDLRLVKGQAFFDVAHDAARPFVVAAAGREVTAIGTRFDVRIDPGLVRVVLVQGRVSVKSADRDAALTMLTAGEQLDDRDGRAPVVTMSPTDEAQGWERGFVTFNDTALPAAAAELNRYGADELVVQDATVARLRITGQFRAGDTLRFGRTLEQIYPVKIVRVSPHRLEVVPAG